MSVTLDMGSSPFAWIGGRSAVMTAPAELVLSRRMADSDREYACFIDSLPDTMVSTSPSLLVAPACPSSPQTDVGAVSRPRVGDGRWAVTRRPRTRSGAGRRSRSRVVAVAARATASVRCPRRMRARARPRSRGCRVAAKLRPGRSHAGRERLLAGVERAGEGRVRQVEQVLELGPVRRHGRAGRAGGVKSWRRVVVVELVGEGRHPLGGQLVDLQRRAGEVGVPDQRAEGHGRRRVGGGRVFGRDRRGPRGGHAQRRGDVGLVVAGGHRLFGYGHVGALADGQADG